MSTTKQRDPRKEQSWRRVLQQWRGSGLSVREFCRQQQVSEARFYAWRRTLQRRAAEAAPFIPVRVVPPPAETAAASDATAGLELVLAAGRRLRIGPAFDAATLRRLLTLLEEGRPCC